MHDTRSLYIVAPCAKTKNWKFISQEQVQEQRWNTATNYGKLLMKYKTL